MDDASWWHVPGQSPQAVIAWEGAHLPHGFTQGGTGTSTGSGAGQTYSDATWTLAAVPGVLLMRWLAVTVVTGTAGGTDVRVDAEVEWLPPRPASTLVPGGIEAVVVTAEPGMNDRHKPPAPVTVTDPGRVRRLVSLVNGLPLSPRGVYSCPFDDGRGVRLTFLARPGGPVVAVAFAKANGCGGVLLTIGHGPQTGLSGGDGAAQQVLTISGMHWTLAESLP